MIVVLGLCCLLIDWLPSENGSWGGSFEIGRPRSTRWKNFGRRWKKGLRGLENWIIFMEVICVSSLSRTKERRWSL